MIKAVVFDADNTLYNSQEVAKAADRVALKFFGAKRIQQSNLLLELRKIISKVKSSKNPKLRFRNYSYMLLARRFKLKGHCRAYRIFLSEVLKGIRPEPYASDMLSQLKTGYKTAVFTEDPRGDTIRKLKKTGLKRYFRTIISNNETGIMKPHKRYYALITKRLRLRPEEIVIVGDSYGNDIAMAKRLGFTTVLYKGKGKADYCINSHRQLLKILEKL